MIKNKSQILKYVNITLTVGVIFFAYLYGKSLFENVSETNYSINYWVMASSVVVFFIFYLIFAYHWLRVCRQFEKMASTKQVAVFFASQPYKYLPTSLFTFSFRAKFAKDAGMDLKKSSLAQLVENINILLGALVLVTITYLIYVAWLLAIIILVVGFITYFSLPKKTTLSIKKKSITIQKQEFVSNVLLVALGWLTSGVSFYLVTVSLGADTNFLLAVVSNTVAYIAGLLVIFSPGGVGIRELVFSLFAITSSAIVFWRIVTFICDIIFGFGALAFLKYRKDK